MTRRALILSLCILGTSSALLAESKNPADYPLRIHIFGRSQTTFYHNRVEEEDKGDGRANLFENGEPHAVDFSFECPEKLRTSIGYETYPARWKRVNQQLTLLLPLFGKSHTFWTCNLKTDVKDTAYAVHNGNITAEPAADFKSWMLKHDYDPEHGKDTPTSQTPQAAPPH
jgi:hypothetical protein